MHENNSRCTAYTTTDRRITAAVMAGQLIALRIDDRVFLTAADITARLEEAARIANADYDDYEGWDDLHILLDGDVHELRCTDCPWRNECEEVEA